MAWVAIPNNPDWEYNNDPTDPGATNALRRQWVLSSSGVRQQKDGTQVYVQVRRVGDTANTNKGELSKSFWDARGTEDNVVVSTSFDMTVRTTAANETFTIPLLSSETYNATIDWGDDSTGSINGATLSHTYASAGDHAISISGTFPSIFFNNNANAAKVIEVTNLGQVGWTNTTRAFWGCTNMTSFTSGVTDTSSVTDMNYMFRDCTNLTSVDVSSFNTSSVSSMLQMFFNCTNLTSIDVSNFDTSNVTRMDYMFANCFNCTSVNVSNWDTSSVHRMYSMFSLTGRDISGTFDIIGVENFSIEGLNAYYISFRDFLIAPVGLPTARYDAFLINLDAQTSPSLTLVGFGSSKYTAGGAAEAARASLISNDGWSITDGGAA
jgi:surface protein